jgi:hypothetical protein
MLSLYRAVSFVIVHTKDLPGGLAERKVAG